MKHHRIAITQTSVSNQVLDLYTRYVNHPEGEKVTNDSLSSEDYEIEALGIRYPAKLHLKSPFDSKNMRIQGEYDPEEIR